MYRLVFEPATSQSEVISVVSHFVSQLVRRVNYTYKIKRFSPINYIEHSSLVHAFVEVQRIFKLFISIKGRRRGQYKCSSVHSHFGSRLIRLVNTNSRSCARDKEHS